MRRTAGGCRPHRPHRRHYILRPAPSTAMPGTASATAGPSSRRSPGRPPAAAAPSCRGSTPRGSWPLPGGDGLGSWGTRCLRTSLSRSSARSARRTTAPASGSGVARGAEATSPRRTSSSLTTVPSCSPNTRQWLPVENSEVRKDGIKGTYRVDVDIPANDWINVTKFYDVLIFNTGHWWDRYKFPKDTPLVFYKGGKPIEPPLDMHNGLKVVLKSIASYIEREVPRKTLKLWRTQSPRHFYGGEWDHNGSCVSDRRLEEHELNSWFDPQFGGVNKEARTVNLAIQEALAGTEIQLLNLTYMSEFRADAHPAIWLGKKDAVAVYGQDCMHWCLPGVPDTWVDILAAQIMHHFKQEKG
ncbi:putative DUF231 domain containing family protein isoform X1 [Zea mays]|uniref:Trichome birefringence-like C-terminal domain-containing protein n=1 Tax=Zea mays TaxID=4577 RepID=A0A804LMY4_MAIZE|nr:putative DUF231 domain containing family protein isoform X1 [Zea mays]|eukprot:XP_008667935.1 putative DUF231 domain containing family protein isoform X2 [Zea mays]